MPAERQQPAPKAISPARDRIQSNILTWTLISLLAYLCFAPLTSLTLKGLQPRLLWQALAISLIFAALVRLLRAGTIAAALVGAMICLPLCWYTTARSLAQSALPSLVALFVLTFLCTRAGRTRKAASGLAEGRKGRSAAQVLANLGTAALATQTAYLLPVSLYPSATELVVLAALAEATADTVSSEIGQAFGGQPILITTLKPVPPGTDGAVTFLGTAAGIASALVLTAIGTWTMHLSPTQALIPFSAGTAGLFFDSLLGATLERRAYLNNDLVNFASTVFAGATALAFYSLMPSR